MIFQVILYIYILNVCVLYRKVILLKQETQWGNQIGYIKIDFIR